VRVQDAAGAGLATTAAPTSGESWPILGDLPAIRRDALGFLRRAAGRGDVVRLRLGPDVYLLNHPDHVQRVLQDNQGNYRKNFFYQRTRPLVGDGLLISEGATWRRHRRLIQPAFHREQLAGFTGLMARETSDMLDRWAQPAASGEPVDISAEMMRLTLAIVGRALFGADLLGAADDAGRALTVGLHITARRFWTLLYIPPWIPSPMNLRFNRARRVLDRVVNGIIAGHREGEARQDLLGMLMAARDADTGQGLTDAELRDELMTMVLAGHETSANALAWAFYLLGQSPEEDGRLHQEAAQTLGGRSATLEDLPRLPLAMRVQQEALRLYPPVWSFGREAIGPDVIGRHEIPAGAALTLVPWLLHRDPRFWKEPDRFDPDRFLPEPSAGRPRFAYFPFGGGPRMCIGYAFAGMEIQVALAMVAARYRLEPVASQVEPEAGVTLRPRGGLWMRIRPRR
jgi:cytochrome P450